MKGYDIMKNCKFCEKGHSAKGCFYDYYNSSKMTAFIADMKIIDKENKMIISIYLVNGELQPDNNILPYTLCYNINYCPFCGKPLFNESEENTSTQMKYINYSIDTCNFCNDNILIKDISTEKMKENDKLDITSYMKLMDLKYAKDLLEITLESDNCTINPSHFSFPWNLVFKLNYCPICGKPLIKKK